MRTRPPPPPVLLPPVGGRPLHSAPIAAPFRSITPLLASYAGRFFRSIPQQSVLRYSPSPPRQAAAHSHPPGRYWAINDGTLCKPPSDYGCTSDHATPSDYGFLADLRGFYGCTSEPSTRACSAELKGLKRAVFVNKS